jgi:hypothetical protein
MMTQPSDLDIARQVLSVVPSCLIAHSPQPDDTILICLDDDEDTGIGSIWEWRFAKAVTALPILARAVERLEAELHEAQDEAKSTELFRDLCRRTAGALGLLEPRTDETGEDYLPSWHDMPERVAALVAERDEARTRAEAAEGMYEAIRRDCAARAGIDLHTSPPCMDDFVEAIVELRAEILRIHGEKVAHFEARVEAERKCDEAQAEILRLRAALNTNPNGNPNV